jgi:hypothetical protein
VISRRYLGSTSRLSSWMLAVALAVPAASPPAWTLRLAIHYLPPATNHSQYDVVLAWPGQAWFLGGTDIGGHGKPKAERIKNGIPRAFLLPAHEHSWITAASAPAPTDIWAVTFLGGYVLHWNGRHYRDQPDRRLGVWYPRAAVSRGGHVALQRHHLDQGDGARRGDLPGQLSR